MSEARANRQDRRTANSDRDFGGFFRPLESGCSRVSALLANLQPALGRTTRRPEPKMDYLRILDQQPDAPGQTVPTVGRAGSVAPKDISSAQPAGRGLTAQAPPVLNAQLATALKFN